MKVLSLLGELHTPDPDEPDYDPWPIRIRMDGQVRDIGAVLVDAENEQVILEAASPF